MSVPNNPNLNMKSKTDPPKSDVSYIRDRRMSMPGTPIPELELAKEDPSLNKELSKVEKK